MSNLSQFLSGFRKSCSRGSWRGSVCVPALGLGQHCPCSPAASGRIASDSTLVLRLPGWPPWDSGWDVKVSRVLSVSGISWFCTQLRAAPGQPALPFLLAQFYVPWRLWQHGAGRLCFGHLFLFSQHPHCVSSMNCSPTHPGPWGLGGPTPHSWPRAGI